MFVLGGDQIHRLQWLQTEATNNRAMKAVIHFIAFRVTEQPCRRYLHVIGNPPVSYFPLYPVEHPLP